MVFRTAAAATWVRRRLKKLRMGLAKTRTVSHILTKTKSSKYSLNKSPRWPQCEHACPPRGLLGAGGRLTSRKHFNMALGFTNRWQGQNVCYHLCVRGCFCECKGWQRALRRVCTNRVGNWWSFALISEFTNHLRWWDSEFFRSIWRATTADFAGRAFVLLSLRKEAVRIFVNVCVRVCVRVEKRTPRGALSQTIPIHISFLARVEAQMV